MEGSYKLLEATGDTVLRRDCWLGDVMVPKLSRVGRHQGQGELGNHQLTAVVLEGNPNTPSILSAEVPRLPATWLGMDNDVNAQRSEGCCTVVELLSSEEVPCRDGWIGRRLTQHVQCHLSLRQQQVPQVAWEVPGYAGKDRKEVGLE